MLSKPGAYFKDCEVTYRWVKKKNKAHKNPPA